MFEQDHNASGAILLSQSREDLAQQGQRPATLINLVGSCCISCLKTVTLPIAEFIQWNQLLTFTPFDCHGAVALVCQEMFERGKQIRPQPSFLLANRIEITARKQQREKALSEVFCLLRWSALTPHKAVDRSPIRAAKPFQ